MPNSFTCKELLGDKLNEHLDTVYDLADASEGVSNDLEKIIAKLVSQVEEMVDTNDKLMESWK